jgi:hypothetical protein
VSEPAGLAIATVAQQHSENQQQPAVELLAMRLASLSETASEVVSLASMPRPGVDAPDTLESCIGLLLGVQALGKAKARLIGLS